jgi:hypothetical protein
VATPAATKAAEKGLLDTLNLEVILVGVLVATSFLLIVASAFIGGQAPHSYSPAAQVPLDQLPPSLKPPGVDTDGDSLFDIDENYIYGTDTTKDDTDGDGMPDAWEVEYKDARNPDTRELVIDPVDPTDAYEDPDTDGYDFNNNGRIDTFQDSVVRTNLSIPVKAQYSAKGVCQLAQNQLELDGQLLHFDRVAVMDNGTYGAPSTNPSSDISVRVTDVLTSTTAGGTTYVPSEECTYLRVELLSGSNRPARLVSWQKGANLQWLEGSDLINIEGIFHVDPTNAQNWWLDVRGGEVFPNIQEYQTWQDYDSTGKLNGSDPLVRDTDGDGMWDGFEAHYGKGHPEVVNGSSFTWAWDFFLSTVNTTDADEDPDDDGLRITWTELVRACLLRDVNGTCIREVPSAVSPGDFVLAGSNLHEFYLHTRPDSADSDNDTFPPVTDGRPISEWNTADMQEALVLKTNPIAADTDGEGMDDGWEVYYSLLPLNASDKFSDPDNDTLPNINEYRNPGCRLNPRLNDTDSDVLPDGWEVTYNLDSCRNDASEDVDLTRGVLTPDGLTNLQEYFAGTSPRRVDTDGDQLSDLDEVTKSWSVSVEGKVYYYTSDATRPDTDLDDHADDEDADGNYAPCEEIIDGQDNDGDARYQQNDNLDNDADGVIDDGPFGKSPTSGLPGTDPSSWLPEGVDEEHDLCDWNEVTIYRTNASNGDTDLEGLSDWVELFTDRNESRQGVQITNPNLKDTDGDKLDDYHEVPHEVAGIDVCSSIYLPGFTDAVERCTDPLNPDTDSDGLEDGLEVSTDFKPRDSAGNLDPRIDSSDPTNPDTDGDTLKDGFEFDNSDLDGDGLPTGWELEKLGVYPQAYREADADGSGVDDVREDWDGDGFNNIDEYVHRTDPFDPDTDDNRILDANEPIAPFVILRLPVYSDSDNDLMPNWWENTNGFDPFTRSDGCTGDADGDGFRDLDEYIYNTDPRGHLDDQIPDKFNHVFIASPSACDGDRDGIGDWWEEFYGLNPNDAEDATRNLDKELNQSHANDPATGIFILADNWTNLEEYLYARNPYGHISTNPAMGDSDLDAYDNPNHPLIRADGSFNFTTTRIDYNKFFTDDKDEDPVVLWHAKVPVNPSLNASALSPIVKGDSSGDIDRDGINNSVEAVKETSAFDPDSDGDGMPDGWEVQYGVANATTGRPILDPLFGGDANDDPDNDGWNYSRVMDSSLIDPRTNGPSPILSRVDFNGDGLIDNLLDNEQFSSLEEYFFGDDVNGDGINDVTTHPGKAITNADRLGRGPIDGFVMYFRDRDFDQLPRWYEVMFKFDDADRTGSSGRDADPDLDGVKNVIEARSIPWTNPLDPLAFPPMCSWPREFLPDPANPPPPC